MPEPEHLFDDCEPEDLTQAVFTALGAASACWDNLEDAGVFESERARRWGNDLVKWINNNYDKKEAPRA